MLGFLWAILLFIQMFKCQDVFILKEKMEKNGKSRSKGCNCFQQYLRDVGEYN